MRGAPACAELGDAEGTSDNGLAHERCLGYNKDRYKKGCERVIRREDFNLKPLTCIAAIGAALLMTHSALAASGVAKVCAADIKAQCADVKPGGGKLKDCVKAHFSDLSADCQVAIVRAAAVGKACKADVKQFCADVKPGKGAIADCMKEHTDELSDSCKNAMAKTEAGNK
jgi:Cysteine rich repeat